MFTRYANEIHTWLYICVTSSSLESVVPPNSSISSKVQTTSDSFICYNDQI